MKFVNILKLFREYWFSFSYLCGCQASLETNSILCGPAQARRNSKTMPTEGNFVNSRWPQRSSYRYLSIETRGDIRNSLKVIFFMHHSDKIKDTLNRCQIQLMSILGPFKMSEFCQEA